MTICEGAPAYLYFGATGANFSYQWMRSNNGGATWTPISGATSKSWVLYPTTLDMNNNLFKCVVTGLCYSGASNTITMTVVPKPIITLQPVSTVVNDGEIANFSTEAIGDVVYYSWMYSSDGGESYTYFDGAYNSNFSFAATSDMNGYLIACEIGDDCQTFWTDQVTLTVNNAAQSMAQTNNLLKSTSLSSAETPELINKTFIHPNPTLGKINVKIADMGPNKQAQIYLLTVQGAKLKVLTTNSAENPLDLTTYPPGAYIIKVIVGGKVEEFKVLKN